MTADRLYWTDVETFGLKPDSDPIIEATFTVTDLNLDVVATNTWLVWGEAHDHRLQVLADAAAYGDEQAKFVFDMHTKNGLFDSARHEGRDTRTIRREIHRWLLEQGVTDKDPICGSSVHFDRSMLRAQMPAVERLFSYRNIDISTLKELCSRLAPELFKWAEKDLHPAKAHRTRSDVKDTLNEARWYEQNFLFITTADAEGR